MDTGIFPVTPVRKLTSRENKDEETLVSNGLEEIESYSGSTQGIFRMPRNQAGSEGLRHALVPYGVKCDSCRSHITDDSQEGITSLALGKGNLIEYLQPSRIHKRV